MHSAFFSLRFCALHLGAVLWGASALPAIDCDDDGKPDSFGLILAGADCNDNGIPDDCDLLSKFLDLVESGKFAAGNFPTRPAIGDLDGDGDLDLAIGLNGDKAVAILLNQGSARFLVSDQIELIGFARNTLLRDFDGDGDLDLAVLISTPGNLSIFFNSGDASFLRKLDFPQWGGTFAITAADLDGDGDPDLAGTTPGGGLSLLITLGEGAFESRLGASGGTGSSDPKDLAALDVEGDGDLDLAVIHPPISRISIHPNEGGGKFSAARELVRLQFNPTALAAGDFDGDGSTDIATVSSSAQNLYLLFNDGIGDFSRASTYPPGRPPFSRERQLATLVAADLDQDGSLDLAVPDSINGAAGGGILIYRNRGDGRLHEPKVFHAGYGFSGVGLGDLDADGRIDVVASGSVTHDLTVLLNKPASFSSDCDANGIPDECGGDCDQDGIPDACEIASGDEGDCDGNGIPDSCEVEQKDCDGDAILDICAGEAPDCNRNGRPDRCDLAPKLQFDVATVLSASKGPRSLRHGDIDGDGDVDLIWIDIFSKEGWILLNEGDRRFSRPRRFDAGGGLFVRAVVDMDGDERLDLVVSDLFDENVSIIRNRGNGRFLEPIDYPVGDDRFEVEVADMDGDGAPDVVVSTDNRPALFVLWNRNDGTLLPRPGQGGGPGHPGDIALADIDGDSLRDIISTGGLTTRWMRNLGGRQFAMPRQLHNLVGPPVVIADLDGDGDLDLVLSSSINVEQTSVVLNEGGEMQFRLHANFHLYTTPESSAAIDVDLDGDLDLLLGSAVLLNDGKANFARVADYHLTQDSLVAADLDDDGLPDIALNDFSRTVTVLWNRGNASFQGARQFKLGLFGPELVVPADIDGDGSLDLIASTFERTALLLNRGMGSFEVQSFMPDIGPTITADIDGDGREDLVSASFQLDILLNLGNVEFSAPRTLLEGVQMDMVLARDFDADGDIDLAVPVLDQGVYTILMNLGGASFNPVNLPLEGQVDSQAALDFDGDGDLDIALGVVEQVAGVAIIENLGNGRFARNSNLEGGSNAYALVPGDFDSDGDVDIVLVLGFEFMSFKNDGKGVFTLHKRYPAGDNLRAGAASDLEGDGDLDLILVSSGSSQILVFEGKGDGTFTLFKELHSGSSPFGIGTADLDGDRDEDLAVANFSSFSVTVFTNISGATSEDRDQNGKPDECDKITSFHRGDPNGDGWTDISDGLCILRGLFVGGDAPACMESADANNDGTVDCSDAIFILGYLFLGTEPPFEPGPPPFPCGTDPDIPGSKNDLGCLSYLGCE